jgi:hypothetical protein
MGKPRSSDTITVSGKIPQSRSGSAAVEEEKKPIQPF